MDNKEIFIRMREEEYALIPSEIKDRFFTSKNITVETNDWFENMKDPLFEKYYKEKKQAQKHLEKRQYELREERRKNAL